MGTTNINKRAQTYEEVIRFYRSFIYVFIQKLNRESTYESLRVLKS